MLKPTTQSWIIDLAEECELACDLNGKAVALAIAKSRTDMTRLRDALRSGDSLTRRKSMHVMSLWPADEILFDLCEVLRTDTCPIVRHEAAYYLASLKTIEAADALIDALFHDRNALVRHEAAEALGDLGEPSILEALERASTDEDDIVRRTVAIAIAQIRLKLATSHNESNGRCVEM